MAQNLIRVLTFNCNGLNNRVKAKHILSVLMKSQADIIFLQETQLKKSPLSVLKPPWFPFQFQAPDSSKSCGVAILILAKLHIFGKDQAIDPEGRYLFLNVHIEGEPFTLTSLYAPNEKPLEFLGKCLHSLQSFACGPLIVGGDLNCLMDPKLDCSGPRQARDVARQCLDRSSWLCRLLEQFCLHDVWRVLHPKERDFTFFSNCHNSYSRIDYILVSSNIVQNFTDSNTGLQSWSDHAWVEGGFFLLKI